MGWNARSEIAGYLELPGEANAAGESPEADAAAIYVHVPFCTHLCTYCDFDTFTGSEGWMAGYVEAVVEQIRRSPRVRATSLYVGGGTPSLMSPAQAGALVQACRDRFQLPTEAEAAIEANPSGLTPARLQGFRRAGFNRLSLGVQSTDVRLLRLLGRRHKAEESAAATKAARGAGFANLSVDLLYGVPTQEPASWEATLEAAVGWGVDHLSCYALTVEAGTPMDRGVSRGTLQLPPDEGVVAMYEVARRLLGQAGYRRYEISNWALPGRESAHNLTYWRNRPYLGIGAGAAGCHEGRRYKIAPAIAQYIEGVWAGRVPLQEEERLDRRRALSDSLILGLRLEEGISLDQLRRRHGESPEHIFGDALEWASEWGLLERSGDRLKLTEQGVLLSNELFARLL
ncbi:MAG: radical SAM family heme chaperone HemW [Chloroflexota bacterium]